jgi:shikimate dehydrogenase
MEDSQDALKAKQLFGLLGKDIDYSFSRAYFSKKFAAENLEDRAYVNFDLNTINDFPNLLKTHPNLKGLNVTIPYKEVILPFLDKIDKKALKIGAVNTIKFTKKGRLKGYNTDWIGFKKALQPHLKPTHTQALILGTGGASKAIAYALKKLGIGYKFVSRTSEKKNSLTYAMLSEKILKKHTLIINSTPLGTFPDTGAKPEIPYNFITPSHLLFDLIYNPEETTFLKLGKAQGATVLNGLPMLEFQAEYAWAIWNKK